MHRIDDPTAAPTLPAPRPPGTPGYFTGGSPGSSGFAATVVRYEFMNAVQEELAAIVTAAGLALDKTNNQQVLAALQQMLRFKLTQDTTFYISPTGNDTNNGLTPTTAFATGQAAWDRALTIDLNNHNLFLQFANGTYTAPMFCSGFPLGIGAASGIVIQGNISQPSQVVFSTTSNTCLSAYSGASFSVQGITFQATGVPTAPYQNVGLGINANFGSIIVFENCIFGPCSWSHLFAANGGIITTNGQPYSINGGGQNHALTAVGGIVNLVNSAVSLTGNPAFSTAFANAESHGIIETWGCAFAGAATGPRFFVNTGGLIATNNGGLNFLPGSTAGTADASTFGLYL